MINIIKKVLYLAIAGGILYMLLSYHFIIAGNSIKLLKKSQLTLNYTIFSTKGKTVESILEIDELFEDGIGDILVEADMMSQEELDSYDED